MARVDTSARQAQLEALSKADLHQLADGLFMEEPKAIEQCVEFVLAETRGVWHGRARAMMCRRLKHISLTEAQSAQLVARISERLQEGQFAEQFKDQLRFAMHLNASALFNISRSCLSIRKAHVQRYAEWVLSHEKVINHA